MKRLTIKGKKDVEMSSSDSDSENEKGARPENDIEMGIAKKSKGLKKESASYLKEMKRAIRRKEKGGRHVKRMEN